MVLLAADGMPNAQIARAVGVPWPLSTTPELEPKIRDVAGLYLAPPDNAVWSALMRSPRSRPWTPDPASRII
jgi:hypothetical protein